MPTVLENKGQELAAKRASLKQLFASKPDYNFSADEVAEIQRRETELKSLHDEYEGLKKLQTIYTSNESALGALTQTVRDVPFVVDADAGKKGAGKEEQPQFKSLGEMFIESAAFKSWNKSTRSGPSADFNVKTVFATTGGDIGYAPEVIRSPGFVDYKLRQPFMDALIPMGRTTQNAVQYMEEQAPVNGADWVNENDTKKTESNFHFVEKTSNVRKIRISVPVTDEMMQDVPAMMDYVNTRLLNLLALKKDSTLLSGSGTAPELLGILNAGGLQTQAKGADPIPDAYFKALTNIQVNALLEPNHIIMHPRDWQTLRLLRTPEGIYIYGSPLDPATPRMWGLPVTANLGVAQGTGLVGAFDTSCQQFARQDVTLTVSTENEDNFLRGILTLKAEMRLALVIYRPAGFCTVTGV